MNRLWEHAALEWRAADVHHQDFEPDIIERRIARACGELLGPEFTQFAHRFEPQGVSLTIVSSHLTLVMHTWPELNSATTDTCVRHVSTGQLADALSRHLRWELVRISAVDSPAIIGIGDGDDPDKDIPSRHVPCRDGEHAVQE